MIKSFLILTLLKLALCKELCIPQGNKCLYKWQCCKGFHCENPHYQDEKHCIADHEQLEHKSETDPEVSAHFRTNIFSSSEALAAGIPPPPPPDNLGVDRDFLNRIWSRYRTLEPVDPEAKPSVRETMMNLFEAGLQQLTQGKPIKMKVKVKNPDVLLSKLKLQPEPTPQKGEPTVDPAAFRSLDNEQSRRIFKSAWGTHHYKEDNDSETQGKNDQTDLKNPAGFRSGGCRPTGSFCINWKDCCSGSCPLGSTCDFNPFACPRQCG